jgi:hypothetical protein
VTSFGVFLVYVAAGAILIKRAVEGHFAAVNRCITNLASQSKLRLKTAAKDSRSQMSTPVYVATIPNNKFIYLYLIILQATVRWEAVLY